MSQGSNPEDWQAIRAAYEAGKSAKDCRAAFGITKAAWYEAVAHGEIILRRDRIAKPHRQTREAVAALLADGMTQAEIAAALHVARPTVCFHMRKLGIPARTEFTRRYD